MDSKVLGGDRIHPYPDYIPRQPARCPAGLPLPAARRWARCLPGLVVPGEEGKSREGKGRAGQGAPAGRAGGVWSHGQAEAGAERPRRGGAERPGRGSAALPLPPRSRAGGPGHLSPVCSAGWRSSHRGEVAGGVGGRSRVGSASAAPARPGASASPASRGTRRRVPEQDTAQHLRGSFRAW